MKLAIFDIDGTLTDTNSVDDECFVAALADAHGLTGISTDWAAYPHTTDSAIIQHIFRERFGCAAGEDDVARFQQCFVARLSAAHERELSGFGVIAGAAEALRRLKNEGEWAVAIATGCWRASALLKLAQLPQAVLQDIPASYSEDGLSREEILQAVVAQAMLQYRVSRFAKIVSIGDGVWDLRVARQLHYAFIGVAAGEAAAALIAAGATHAIADYSDYDSFLHTLDEADVPRR